MDANVVNSYLAAHASDFPTSSYALLRDRLLSFNENQYNTLLMMQLKNPIVAFVFSFFLGELGIDRFYIGDVVAGVLKLITLGGFGIWWFIDLFLIISATRRKNLGYLLNIQ